MTDFRRNQVDEEEPWLATYADVVTLLLSFFVLLVAIAVFTKDYEDPFAVKSDTPPEVSRTQGLGKKRGGMINKILHPFATDQQGKLIQNTPLSRRVKTRLAYLRKQAQEEIKRVSNIGETKETKTLEEIKAQLFAITSKQAHQNLIKLIVKKDVIQLTLKEKIMFDRGKAIIKPKFRTTLTEICTVVGKMDLEQITVEGHTDSYKIKNKRFNSNWDLGGARAASVIDVCKLGGISPQVFIARSFADTVPDSQTNRPSRRIEVKVKYHDKTQ